ncbi:MAG: alpha/beta fold hydrolase [Bacteroidetes bacterium]|jgi:fermentation-respiration switch protein FrsA (DUF1100 family)|nr:alpha/beta fold hydrolase [Bacteroidota bacterium]
MVIFQNQLIFHPSTQITGTPERLGLPWSEHRVPTSDGLDLHGWLVGDPGKGPVVVYSHGNAGNISGRVEIAGEIARQGASVFMYDYRGYGKSEGKPDEQGIYTDGEAVVHYLRRNLGIAVERMIFYGKSLGGAVAARQSARFNGAGLVLDSAFLNGPEIAGDLYPLVPSFLVSIRFPVDEDLRNTNASRIMILHGTNDRIINIRHGRTLHDIASEKKPSSFVELPGGHNSSFVMSREIYAGAWANFLKSLDISEQ